MPPRRALPDLDTRSPQELAAAAASWSPEELAVQAELGEPPPDDDEVAYSAYSARYAARLRDTGVPGVSGAVLWAQAALAAEYATARAAEAEAPPDHGVDSYVVSQEGDLYEEDRECAAERAAEAAFCRELLEAKFGAGVTRFLDPAAAT